MVYVVRKQTVAQSLARLRNQKTHTLFAGYLHLQQRSSQLKRLDDLHPRFLSFFDQFFRVGDHPLGTPYIKLFTEQKASTRNLWLNKNVAGSYAPSSLRPEQPFRQVVNIKGINYSLLSNHSQQAFVHLLYSNPVQVADLAIVLYRDFGFLNASMTVKDLIAVFAYEFGYADETHSQPDDNFQTLFSLENAKNWDVDWLEAL